ncbi:MAG: DUF5689 domain-containing protein [Bacteroidales bacterium]|nr:DUF5689 domain-containing protein [Bacteroidales bacterium]
MKHIKIYLTTLALVLSLIPFFSSCEKDKIDPPSRQVSIDTIYTVKQLKQLTAPNRPYLFQQNAVTYAVVTMDESQGNIYKQLYVQDSTDAILLVFNAPTNLKVGDSVRIDLNGTTVEINRDAYQISTLSASKNISILARKRFIEPEPVTLEQINSGQFNLKLVKVDGVEFIREEKEVVWGDYITYSTLKSLRDLFDCHGQTLKVLTSGHATFAARPLPQGNGSMVVIASIYSGTMQLLVRDINEVDMKGNRCDGSGGDEVTVLSETFEHNQGKFTAFNKIGENAWTHNVAQKCMQMTKSSEPNEDWLISPALDFSALTTEATLEFQHAIVNNIPGTVPLDYMKLHHTVWFSTNYNDGDPTNASWTQILLSNNDLPSGTNWQMASAALALPSDVLGKNKVHVAYKYTCDENESTTWRINNVLIEGK